MSAEFLLDDQKTSPLLRTIYDSYTESRPFIAVNDQPEKDHDAYNKPVGTESGHVKFVTAAEAVADDTKANATVYSYLIQHSLPRFPRFSLRKAGSAIKASRLPLAKSIFGTNAEKKGQHFMCMSFRDKQLLDPPTSLRGRKTRPTDIQLRYKGSEIRHYLQSGSYNFACVLHYLKVTHAAVIGTNYNAYSEDMAIWHQYLNVFPTWIPKEPKNSKDIGISLNMARSSLGDPDVNWDSEHLCPIFPSPFRVKVDNEGDITGRSRDLRVGVSMRSSSEASRGVCTKWDPRDATGSLCLASAHLKTTSRHYQLKGLLIMKNRLATVAPYDDLLAPLVVPLVDYKTAGAADEESLERVMHVGLIVQSWNNSTTIPSNTKDLLPESSPLKVKLSIVNSHGVSLPLKQGKHRISMIPMDSVGRDHSKWAFAFPKGQTGTIGNLFCTGDLNRTYKHIQNRGGGLLCFSTNIFTELLLQAMPRIHEYTLKPIEYPALRHLYRGFEQSLTTAMKMSDQDVFISSQRDAHFCVYRLPNPFKDDPMPDTFSVPRMQALGTEELTVRSSHIHVHGDFKRTLGWKYAPELPYALAEHKENVSPYLVGDSMVHPLEVEVAESDSGDVLQIPLGIWGRIQQSYHVACGKGQNFTKRWLQAYYN